MNKKTTKKSMSDIAEVAPESTGKIIPEMNEPQPQPLLLDIYAAAQRLSVAPVTIRKLVRQQRLARVPGIRKLLIPEASCRRFAATAE
jgi:hypothetical protein